MAALKAIGIITKISGDIFRPMVTSYTLANNFLVETTLSLDPLSLTDLKMTMWSKTHGGRWLKSGKGDSPTRKYSRPI
jgi:hypothetical protein